MRSRTRLALGVIAVLALVVRFVWASAMNVDPRKKFIFDPTIYDVLARHLAQGWGFVGFVGQPVALYPPGYPAILGAAYFVFGNQLTVAWALNALVGATTCLLIYAIGARLFSASIGLAAAAIFAFFPNQIFAAALTMTESVFVCLFTAILYVLVRWNEKEVPLWGWFLFGLGLGGAALVRGIALLFLVVPFSLWIGSEGLRKATLRTAVVGSALVLVILPWTARNWSVFGTPIFLSSDGGYNFFSAHNPLAAGGPSLAMNQFRRREWPWLEKLPPRQREAVEQGVELRYGLRYMLTHPVHELSLIPRRLYYLYATDHSGLQGYGAWAAPWGDAYYYVVVLLALFGLRGTLAAERARILPFTIIFFSVIHGVLFTGEPRFHAPLIPIFAILAARGVARLLAARKRADPEAPAWTESRQATQGG
jgi:4-amino-4-deoxy-L-arabinose transferase-like glycosyltransferase